MDTISPAQENTNSVPANPSSIKSDDSSPPPESGRGSPPPKCAICLGTCRNKSFTDSCLHQFCFNCLLTWSKVKAECPLCKQIFKSIIHNVRSNDQYEEYMVEQHTEESVERVEIDASSNSTRRFRYRTTLTLQRRDSLAIQQLLINYPLMSDMLPRVGVLPPAPAPDVSRRRREPASFRRTVYRHNLWARPLPDFTGRFRDCSPEFYRYNDAQMHRLVPWLNRELHYLLNENVAQTSYIMTRILGLLPMYHINSIEFREAVMRYFGDRTDHFLHELHCFASTPYDMNGYDRNVHYTTDPRMSSMVNEVISSSESEASVDSDIVMVSSSEPAPTAGPSRPPAPCYPPGYISNQNASVIPIETISHSDTDDDSSEVMVVGYIKPPQDRTPEVVDLLGSDSDVVVQESPENPPDTTDRMVKLTLTKQRLPDSDSEDEVSQAPPPPRPRKRRADPPAVATASRARRSRSPESDPSWSGTPVLPTPSSSASLSSISSSILSHSDLSHESSISTTSTTTSAETNSLASPSSTENSADERPTLKRKANTERDSKLNQPAKKKLKSKKSRKEPKERNRKLKHRSSKTSHKKKRTKSKSNPQDALDQPSTSGTASRSRSSNQSSGGGERRRLRSVVKVINSSVPPVSNSSMDDNENNSAPRNLSGLCAELAKWIESNGPKLESLDSGSIPIIERTRRNSTSNKRSINVMQDTSDSDDDIPLNLTIKRP